MEPIVFNFKVSLLIRKPIYGYLLVLLAFVIVFLLPSEIRILMLGFPFLLLVFLPQTPDMERLVLSDDFLEIDGRRISPENIRSFDLRIIKKSWWSRNHLPAGIHFDIRTLSDGVHEIYRGHCPEKNYQVAQALGDAIQQRLNYYSKSNQSIHLGVAELPNEKLSNRNFFFYAGLYSIYTLLSAFGLWDRIQWGGQEVRGVDESIELILFAFVVIISVCQVFLLNQWAYQNLKLGSNWKQFQFNKFKAISFLTGVIIFLVGVRVFHWIDRNWPVKVLPVAKVKLVSSDVTPQGKYGGGCIAFATFASEEMGNFTISMTCNQIENFYKDRQYVMSLSKGRFETLRLLSSEISPEYGNYLIFDSFEKFLKAGQPEEEVTRPILTHFLEKDHSQQFLDIQKGWASSCASGNGIHCRFVGQKLEKEGDKTTHSQRYMDGCKFGDALSCWGVGYFNSTEETSKFAKKHLEPLCSQGNIRACLYLSYIDEKLNIPEWQSNFEKIFASRCLDGEPIACLGYFHASGNSTISLRRGW